MKNKADNRLAIQALQAKIQLICFDANLFDLGIATYPHAESCSKKRRELNAEIVRLGGKVKLLPFQQKTQTDNLIILHVAQLELFTEVGE
jgi:hypothetical protein